MPVVVKLRVTMRLCNSKNLVFLARLLIISILVSHSNNVSAENENDEAHPEVSIPQGNIRGINMVTNHERVIHGFLGIPFAEPPIGDLRFKSPVAASTWTGTLNATEDASMCPQFTNGEFIGDEDCLFLNVYTPQLPSTDSKPLPVMVWIYGGAFSRGTGDSSESGPYYILDRDVVFVAINYRLGPLGFLSTGDEVSPGNYGMKDQVEALKWVQTNIKYFGGDPSRVTIFGISSGAASVDLLLLSDLANGLFHQCIKLSGASFSPRAYVPRDILVRDSNSLGEHLGCPTTTSTALVNCLRKLNATQIVNTTSLFLEWDVYPDIIWRPTDEPKAEGAFLTNSPANLYAAGKVKDLPCISGLVRDEGLYYTDRFYENPDLFDDFLIKIDDVLPYILLYQDRKDASTHTAALKAFYLNDLTADRNVLLANLTNLIGDVYYIYPTYRANREQFRLGKTPKYLYSFEYLRSYKDEIDPTVANGIPHADDEYFIFEFIDSILSEADYQMVDIMVDFWTSFATNGTPSADESVTWQQYSWEDNYLRIGNQADLALEMETSYLKERMQFWDGLTTSNSKICKLVPRN